MVIVDAAQLIIPQIIRHAIDILKSSSFDKNKLIVQCIVIIAAGLAMAVLRYFWRNLLMGSARYVEKGIRNDLFRHILVLDMSYYDKVKTGDIMAHAISDINHIRMAFGFGLVALVDTVLLGSATLGIMIYASPRLTALAMIPMPFLIIMTKILGRKMHEFHGTAQESYSKLTEFLRESFSGIRIIKVFNFEPLICTRIENASKDYFRKNFRRAFISALLKPLLTLFFNISTLIIVFYGGFLVIKHKITPGELVAFLQYLGILAWPVIAIGWMANLFQRGMASLSRINRLIDTVPDVRPPDVPVVPLNAGGNILFQDVNFYYEKGKNVLSRINLEIQMGSKIGITGAPGSGKTSLVQLIPRLYNASAGNIFIDGIDINLIDLDFLRRQIAFMPQEPFIFSGTIRDNILMGRNVNTAEFRHILHVCCLEETLENMEKGLDTIVGEKGITLSGGQKQRIALARTLIHKKPVIILDDPISQMDTITASQVINRINRMDLNSSLVIISHRISAISFCNTIYILKNGKIINSGTHEELIVRDLFYRQLCTIQKFEGNFNNQCH